VLEAPNGHTGFWTRLPALSPPALFVWGRHDTLVPLAFKRHVAEMLPAAAHTVLDCGHVPQLERPLETHDAAMTFLKARARRAQIAA
jgi:2-hydroxy-6-oxonona-2,4-dienedioate hydrolase